VARNRKRAKERRSRRPASSQLTRPGGATTREREARDVETRDVEAPSPIEHEAPEVEVADDHSAIEREAPEVEIGDDHSTTEHEAPDAEIADAPSPIEHATPDVEIADAQLALGRPDLAHAVDAETEPEEYDEDAEAEFDEEEDIDGAGLTADESDGRGGSGGGAIAVSGSGGAPAARRVPGNRLINFLQGSWRELQRVQWPERRQVMQATGVVIGFVIVAGVYLGIADEIATRIVRVLLK
jgi:preprotein translocase subunit SecE